MAFEPPRIRYRDDNTAVAAYHLVHRALVAPRQRIQEALAALPVVQKGELAGVDLEEPCPICLVPLSTVFADDEARAERRRARADTQGEEDEEDEETDGEVLTGVTKLVGCGHVFCRRDLTQWIRSHHGNCPTCRHTFMDLRPVDHDDDESSDGGEYVPDDFEDEEDDGFLDIDVDGYTDTEGEDFPVETMELDVDAFYPPEGDSEMGDALDEFADGAEEYEDEGVDADVDVDIDYAEEWGLTDGESESMSSSDEGMGMGVGMPGGLAGEEAASTPDRDREVSVSAHEDELELETPFERDAGLSVGADGALANAREEKTNEA